MIDLKAAAESLAPCVYTGGQCNSSRCPCRRRPEILKLLHEIRNEALVFRWAREPRRALSEKILALADGTKTCGQIAVELDLPRYRIVNEVWRMRENGVFPNMLQPSDVWRKRNEALMADYSVGISIPDLAKKYGVHKKTIYTVIRKEGRSL